MISKTNLLKLEKIQLVNIVLTKENEISQLQGCIDSQATVLAALEIKDPKSLNARAVALTGQVVDLQRELVLKKNEISRLVISVLLLDR